MGVKLQKIISREKIDLKLLAGRIVAIDAPNIIMSLFNFTRKNSDGTYGRFILDRTQRPISHLYGLLYRISFYYSQNIFPIFCFDGRISDLKRIITKDQLNDFRFTQKWYESTLKSGNAESARKIALSKEFLWQNIINESKKLLSTLGVSYIESPVSAEAQCAQLVKNGIAHLSNSQDLDSLVFGCPYLIQNLSKSLRRKVQGKWTYQKIIPVQINLNRNLEQLRIDKFQLVDMTILIGCDYFPGIKGIGPKKALNLIKKYHSLEKVILCEKLKYNFKPLTAELISKIRKLFLLPDVLNSYSDIVWNLPNESQVLSFLCHNHYLNEERVKNNLKKLMNYFQTCRTYFLSQKGKPFSTQKTLYDYSSA